MVDSAAVKRAKERRSGQVVKDRERDAWFIDHVSKVATLSAAQRVNLGMQYLQSKIAKNISVPVIKTISSKNGISRTVVTGRSKPGEFPRADTTMLMKSIFSGVSWKGDTFDGFVGTPIDYGVILEMKMDRSFLRRTFKAEKHNIIRIMKGPEPV